MSRHWSRCWRNGAVLALLAFVAACEGRPSYFPLDEGRQWRYRLLITPHFEVPEAYKSIHANLAPVEIDGRTATPRRHANGLLYYYSEDEDGITRLGVQYRERNLVEREPERRYVLRYPLAVGASWSAPTRTYLLLKRYPLGTDYQAVVSVTMTYEVESLNATVRAPAGEFKGCLKVRGEGKTVFHGERGVGAVDVVIRSEDWYAPGVGLVKSSRVESTSSEMFGDIRMESALEGYAAGGWF